MSQRSNKKAAEVLALAPVNALDDEKCIGWFATCFRWASIELYEPVKEAAWLGLKEGDRLGKRDIYLMTLKKELQAYINVYSTEQVTPANLNPSVPSEKSASSSMSITWPTEGPAAASPTLPKKESL